MSETANLNLKPLAQEEAWRSLRMLAKALPQGLILVGPSGVGKKRSVRALFQLLNCTGTESVELPDEPCGACVSCRKIAENKHPDFIEVLPKGETIPVDDLREMKKTLFFPPMEGKWRFVVIDEAHKLNAASANTLLKTLEEPPAHTRFFLITHERGLLLPTIVSRCQFIHFSPLDRESIQMLLARMEIEIPQPLLGLCLDLLAGGLDRAPLLANPKTLDFLSQVDSMLDSVGGRWDRIVELADQLTSEDWKLQLLLDVIVRRGHALAVRLSHQAGSAPELARSQANLAISAAQLRRRLERHANKKLVALAAANLTAADERTRSL